ncbi:hypothetical protein GCM10023188_25910 [Pontibacter saemangeumensis]|uniref:Uncharacterized protein n=1 Tax=Pontibacter saemangeumensis TaxID=1084525 RepID=A0ABP8LR59_9BACT
MSHEQKIAQEITRLCSDKEHSMPVLPPDEDGWELEEFEFEEEDEEEDDEPVYRLTA